MNTCLSFDNHQLPDRFSREFCCGRITHRVCFRKDEFCIIKLRLGIDAGGLPAHQSLRLVPVLESAGVHRELPWILINGRARHSAYRSLFGPVGFFTRSLVDECYHIYRSIEARDDLFMEYHIKIAYQPWMENCQINLRED